MGYFDVRGTKDANFWGGGGGPIKGSAIVSDIAGSSFRACNIWQKDTPDAALPCGGAG